MSTPANTLTSSSLRLLAHPTAGNPDIWQTRTLTQLMAHIVSVHHEPDRRELARLSGLSTTVAKLHGGRHPETLEVQAMVAMLSSELEPHMMKEEMVLFPYIRELESTDDVRMPGFGTVTQPIRMMTRDHEVVKGMLLRLADLTNGFVAPPDVSASYRALCRSLEALDRELYQHMHLENDILFPRAVRLEAQFTAPPSCPRQTLTVGSDRDAIEPWSSQEPSE
jgi:regulator of cell morphogenesis and NO signaling